jgi:hypothetical protein
LRSKADTGLSAGLPHCRPGVPWARQLKTALSGWVDLLGLSTFTPALPSEPFNAAREVDRSTRRCLPVD